MPVSGAGTAARERERQSQNGGDPGRPRAGGFGRPSLLRRLFDEVQSRSAIPLVSIVRATSDYAKALGLKNVGLFGTGFTMRASFYL